MSPIRPIFQEGERLTARRINAAVEYLRSTLRRVLLAPLSPGVAIGLELTQAPGASSITVNPGIAIDGRGRLLVLSDSLTVGIVDVQAQLPDLGVGETFSVHLALDDRAASFDPCAPQLPLEVVERVKLVFRKVAPASTALQILPQAGLLGLLRSLAPSLAGPWNELDPAGRSSDDFRVLLGQATWDGTSIGGISMSSRTGVVPRFGGLRNSFGEMSLVLGRDAAGKATIGVAVPTVFGIDAAVTFQAPVDFQTNLLVKGAATFQESVSFQQVAGGPMAQAAVVASDVGAPPAGRVNAIDARVFEAAGGRANAAVGASGVLAVSMEYDVPLGTSQYSFASVPHAGFPLALSTNVVLGGGPALGPFVPGFVPSAVGLSAAASYGNPSGATTVPVAQSGIVSAYITNPGITVLPIGTELTADTSNVVAGSRYPLRAATSGELVLAMTTVPVPSPSSGQPEQASVWVMSPYPKP
jgi:hypothetical protein